MTHTAFTAVWSGASGLPGYSKFRFNGELAPVDAAVAAGRIKSMFQTIATLLPASVTISFPNVAQVFTPAGVLTSEVTFGSISALTGSGAGVFAAPAGACINWTTGGFFEGRKVRGRTFIVPLAGVAYQSDGTLADAAKTTINDAASALRAGTPQLIIHQQHGPGSGDDWGVTGASVSDRVSILRSRRA